MRIGSASGSMPAAAVAAEHVRQRDLGVGLGDPRRVEPDGGAAVRRLDALALLDLVEDRLRDLVARAERVGELLAVGVQEHGAVGARRLGDRVALHVLGPGAAVRVVLERVEVARLGAERRARSASPRRSRPGGSSRARRAPRPRGSSGRRPRGRRRPPRARARRSARASRSRRARARLSGDFGKARARRRPRRLAQRLRDREARPVADLEQALARRAAAARQPVAAVLARELDAVLLEPVDRARRLRGEDLDELAVRPSRASSARRPRRGCSGESSSPKAAWMPPCALAELQDWSDALGRERTRAPARSAETAAASPEAPAADHEHVKGELAAHGAIYHRIANCTH